MNFVYSTLACDTEYAVYRPSTPGDNFSITEKTILIRGGTGVAQKKTMVTPRGVVTQVTDEELELLINDYHFKEHMKHGFITYEKREKPVEQVVKDMNLEDKSRQVTPEDYDKENNSTTVSKSSQRRRG